MEYELKLTQQDIKAILEGLSELPLKVSASAFGKIHGQVQRQDADNAIAAVPERKKD